MEKSVEDIDRITHRQEAMLNEQALEAAIDAAWARYLCGEAVRIYDAACYMLSSNVIFHILRWGMIHMSNRCGLLSWRIDMLEKTRYNIRIKYNDFACNWRRVSDSE